MNRPALLGGTPIFPAGLPVARPAVPSLERVTARLRPSWSVNQLTNGALVRELEAAAAERLGVRHAVAVSCCTTGLMLALRAVLAGTGIGQPGVATRGRVVMPSFTFSATGHAAAWNGADPVFAECDGASFQLDPDDTKARLAESGAAALMATHVFGAPCAAEAVEALGLEVGVPVVFDAAHGMGALRQGRPLGGFGAAEVFSLSPTKVVVAGEGGIVATDRDDVAEAVRIGRDYANPGDYDTRFVGINARMSELHAAVALESLDDLDVNLGLRNKAAATYRDGLAGIPGIVPQSVEEGDRSTYKDFTVAVDAEDFGLDRDTVRAGLSADGIDTRCYFDPPLHRQQAYAGLPRTDLPATERASSRVISLPMFSGLTEDDITKVVDSLRRLQGSAAEIRRLH